MNAFDYFFETSKELEKDFLLGPKEKISLKELFKRCNTLAAYIDREFPTDEKILLIAHNTVYFITIYFAIIKSGRTCVPINPDIEKSNFDYIVGQCKSGTVFIQEKLIGKIAVENLRIFTEKDLDEILLSPVELNLSENFNGENCAEIIFTSGSTGEPKGVMLSHKNLIANTGSIIEYLGLSSHDIIEIVLPFYYCYGLSLLHTHLRVGGSVVFNNTFIFLGSVLNDLKNYNCTGFAGVPSHFQILLRKSESFKVTKYPALRYVTQAGGKLHDVFIREFLDAHPEIDFNVMYGQTEATARLSYMPVKMLGAKLGSIGKGIPGVELKVVNESGEFIKPGELGEIIAMGDNIMLGYLNDTEASSACIKNGWLHTGDLATVDEDGFIFLKARQKEIIKVGGKRISPKEIEEVIVSIPEVIDCTVFPVYDDILGEAIKASVVIEKIHHERINAGFIKQHCANNLSTFKVPQQIEIKDRVSMSSTGKKIKAENK